MLFKCRALKGSWLDPPVVDPAAGAVPPLRTCSLSIRIPTEVEFGADD